MQIDGIVIAFDQFMKYLIELCLPAEASLCVFTRSMEGAFDHGSRRRH